MRIIKSLNVSPEIPPFHPIRTPLVFASNFLAWYEQQTSASDPLPRQIHAGTSSVNDVQNTSVEVPMTLRPYSPTQGRARS